MELSGGHLLARRLLTHRRNESPHGSGQWSPPLWLSAPRLGDERIEQVTHHHGLLGGEVAEEGHVRDPGGLGDHGDRDGVEPLLGEHPQCGAPKQVGGGGAWAHAKNVSHSHYVSQ